MLDQLGFYKKKKKRDLNPYLTPYIKVGSKQITDLNARAKTITFLEGNIEAIFVNVD